MNIWKGDRETLLGVNVLRVAGVSIWDHYLVAVETRNKILKEIGLKGGESGGVWKIENGV